MATVKRVKYFTQAKLDLIDANNLKLYKKYLDSNRIKNPESHSWGVYENNFKHFLVYLAENWDNIGLYSEEFMIDAVDIMEGYMIFCSTVLGCHKKQINNKIASVSSFYLWSMKRGLIPYHPFDGKLDRMKNADEEKILTTYFLTEEQVETIRNTLRDDDNYDIQDQILFEVAYDSANRLGALESLTISSLNLEEMLFENIREKRGYHVEVVFGETARDLIKQWLEIRKVSDKYDHLEIDSVLIVWSNADQKWTPMKRQSIARRMKTYGQIVGIEDFRPHCMRKSRLNNVYEETGDLALAADLANHKSTETTRQAYIKPKSKAEVRDKINAITRQRKEDSHAQETE